jgi:hypothetical protein
LRTGGRLIAIVDSGPLVAVVDANDADHEPSPEVLERSRLQLVIPAKVATLSAQTAGTGSAEPTLLLVKSTSSQPAPTRARSLVHWDSGESAEGISLQRVEGEQVVLLLLLQLHDCVKLSRSPRKRDPEVPRGLIRFGRRADRGRLGLIDLISARGVEQLPLENEAIAFEARDPHTEPKQRPASRELAVRVRRGREIDAGEVLAEGGVGLRVQLRERRRLLRGLAARLEVGLEQKDEADYARDESDDGTGQR